MADRCTCGAPPDVVVLVSAEALTPGAAAMFAKFVEEGHPDITRQPLRQPSCLPCLSQLMASAQAAGIR